MHATKMYVAVVDDDLSVRKALVRLLQAREFEAEAYESAEAFLISLKNRAPACLILDLHMPTFSGLDLSHYLRRRGIDIPRVVITAHNEPGLQEQALLADASAVLTKPLTEKVLIASIHAAIAGVNRQSPGRML